ncbi:MULTISPECIES: ribonuclease H [unclassified Actinobaculum]|uniref:ribonuclease H family protein n=1 Tax=unclassified Actinobaculum TaxID=2609299 RepID=UPI000D525CBC|nr:MULTISPECIES: ribonuclease H [unclassified Actinobaculum]AWE41450.1 ribonuclease HI [Actinobaculum sp. 313]RTE47711.1 ribonuclease HI [Actinobaculum sp. 352]
MTQWLLTSELAERFDCDSYEVLEALGRIGLAEGAHPTALAVRHDLATSGIDDAGRDAALWDPDVTVLLLGVGMTLRQDAGPVFDQEALFDDDREDDTDAYGPGSERPVEESAGISSRVTSQGGPVGTIRPGFDRIIATDGACSGNPGPGGWAWVEQVSGAWESGGASSTTNNSMELTALIKALEFVGPEVSLLIRCDSQYVINVVTKWAPTWRRRGWKKADGEPVKNRELVETLLGLYEARRGRTEVEWVKGHAGDAANELCDRLASAQARTRSDR